MEEQGSPRASSPPHPPPPLPNDVAFSSLINSLPKKKKAECSKFVKRVEEMSEVSLPPDIPIQVALSMSEHVLVGQFTGLWPSPKATETWVIKNWKPLIKQNVTSHFLGRGYFLFEFTSKEDKELIFRNGPYFMGPQGLYLNKWTPDFDPEEDVPSAVPVWVRLPNLPIHCWNWDSLKHIGDALGKFIDRANNKDQYDCARICVEVDLEVGLPEAIKINVGSWSHIQKLDYEQLSFKCRGCHEYGHFARNCPKKNEEDKDKEEGWKQVKRFKTNPKVSNTAGQEKSKGYQSKGNNASQKILHPKDSRNMFETLDLVSQDLPERDPPQKEQMETTRMEDKEPIEDAVIKDSRHGEREPESSKDKGTASDVESQGLEESEEEGEIGDSLTTVWRSARGRPSSREKREKETYKDKVQGSQPTLEIFFG
jgi:hypothetical protein